MVLQLRQSLVGQPFQARYVENDEPGICFLGVQVFDRARPVERVDRQGADVPWDVLGLLGA